MRTLIVATDSLGDAVMTQPLTALLNRFDPGGSIDVLADPSVAAVFEVMADVARVITTARASGPLRPWVPFGLARRLGSRRHDRVFVLPPATRAALAPWLARIPLRIGLDGDTRWGLINQPHESGEAAGPAPPRPVLERFAHLAFDATQPLPGLIPNPVLARDAVREDDARGRAGFGPTSRLLVLCVACDGSPSRRWPARHWAALPGLAGEEWPELTPVLLGDAPDRAFATEVAALSGCQIRNVCGEQTRSDQLATLAQAEAVVSHDSGLMHVAAAYQRPLVAVYGPTDPRFSPPRSVRARVEWLHRECSPCHHAVCRYGHGQCTAGVRPETVLESLRTAMQFATRDIR